MVDRVHSTPTEDAFPACASLLWSKLGAWRDAGQTRRSAQRPSARPGRAATTAGLRLSILPICIAVSLGAHAADERIEDWRLCPIVDAVPAFADSLPPADKNSDAPPADPSVPITEQATDIDGDTLDGTEGQVMNLHGNVVLRRGDQLLSTDQLSYDQENETYTAEGSVRYQDGGMRLIAARAKGDQAKDTHQLEDIQYQLIARRGNGGAERVEMHDDQGSLIRSNYSTCPPDARLWELRAARIDVDTKEGLGTARNATLHVGKVPRPSLVSTSMRAARSSHSRASGGQVE
ncbi:MAG: hypothetical protein E6Q88_08350 [Lysobacteraceae bacterium]|nr:MAG: hypothetical protein E6Q88_08350 [Xanthomonadaceae bacterium]